MKALDSQTARVMVALATLADVEKCLRFLANAGVVKEESIAKGCRKYVKDHPEIQAWIDRDRFIDDMGANDQAKGREHSERPA